MAGQKAISLIWNADISPVDIYSTIDVVDLASLLQRDPITALRLIFIFLFHIKYETVEDHALFNVNVAAVPLTWRGSFGSGSALLSLWLGFVLNRYL